MGLRKDEIRNYSQKIFDKLVVQIIWTTIVAIIAGIGAYFVSRKNKFSDLEIVLFIALAVFAIIVASYLIYRKNNKRLPHIPEIDPNFCMLREERVHKWLDADNYSHKRRYTLKALKGGLTHYTDKFQWTGPEYKLSGSNENYTIEKEAISKNVFEVYSFRFKKPLKKGETIELEASWAAKGPAKPFFSTTIEEPTDMLIMSIMLYPGCGITQVNCEIEPYKGAMVAIESKKVKLNSDGEYTWQITKPKLLFHYEINW